MEAFLLHLFMSFDKIFNLHKYDFGNNNQNLFNLQGDKRKFSVF